MGWLKENPVLAAGVILFFLLSVWVQPDLPTKVDRAVARQANEPDYFIENPVSTTSGENGREYRVVADRLTHYPAERRSLLSNPQVIQYDSGRVLSHIYAQTGWIYDDRSTVLLDGNVRAFESRNGVSRSVAASDKMTINLKGEQ